MRFGKIILGGCLCAGLVSGCDGNTAGDAPPVLTEAHASPPNHETKLPEGPVPPADQATTRPTVVILVAGGPQEFPSSRLIVDDRNGKTIALLMSEDPPAAINDDFLGNSYYLEMEFDDLLPTVRGQVWQYEAPDSEKQHTPSGLFLQGNRWQLQPFQVQVQFQQLDGTDVAWLSGTFRMYRAGEHPAMPRVVAVTGRVPVVLP